MSDFSAALRFFEQGFDTVSIARLLALPGTPAEAEAEAARLLITAREERRRKRATAARYARTHKSPRV